MQYSKAVIWRIIILLMLVAIVEQFATNCYLPSFPDIAKTFAVNNSTVQLSLTIFMVGEALAQLLFGSLADLYGRKPSLVIGLIIFSFSSLLCTLAPDIKLFLIGRFLQGFGVGSGLVVARAVARDLFSDVQFAQIISSIVAIIVLLQLISPVIGGYLQHYFGWHAVFILITTLAFLLLVLIIFLFTETYAAEKRQAAKLIDAVTSYAFLLKNKMFLLNVLYASFAAAIVIIYTTITPFLYQHALHISPIQFGWLTTVVAFSIAIGNFLNSNLVAKQGIDNMIRYGICIMSFSLVVMLIFGLVGILNIWVIAIPTFFAIIGTGFISANVAAKAFSQCPNMAGNAAAIYGTIQFVILSIFSGFSTLFHSNNQIPLALIMLIPIILMWLLQILGKAA